MNKFRQTIRRLLSGVKINRGRITGQYFEQPPLNMTLILEHDDDRSVFRAIIFVSGQVAECYENKSLNALRKLIMAYHPSAAKYFGPARMYVGI